MQRLEDAEEQGHFGDGADEEVGGTERDKNEMNQREVKHFEARKEAINKALLRVEEDVKKGTPEGKAIAFEARHYLRWKAAKEDWEQNAYTDISSVEANRTEAEAGADDLLAKYAEHTDNVLATQDTYEALLNAAYARDLNRTEHWKETMSNLHAEQHSKEPSEQGQMPTEMGYNELLKEAYEADANKTERWRQEMSERRNELGHNMGHEHSEEQAEAGEEGEGAGAPEGSSVSEAKATSKPALASSKGKTSLVDASLVVAKHAFEFPAKGMVGMKKGETARLIKSEKKQGVAEIVTSEGKIGMFPVSDLAEAKLQPPLPPHAGPSLAGAGPKDAGSPAAGASAPAAAHAAPAAAAAGGESASASASPAAAIDIPALRRAAVAAAVEAEERIRRRQAAPNDVPGHGFKVVAGAIADAEGEFERDENAERLRSATHRISRQQAQSAASGAGGGMDANAVESAVAAHYARYANAVAMERRNSQTRRIARGGHGNALAASSVASGGSNSKQLDAVKQIEAKADERIKLAEAASRERDEQEASKMAEEQQEQRVALKQANLMTASHDGGVDIDGVSHQYDQEEQGLQGLEKAEDMMRLKDASKRIIAGLLAKDLASKNGKK